MRKMRRKKRRGKRARKRREGKEKGEEEKEGRRRNEQEGTNGQTLMKYLLLTHIKLMWDPLTKIHDSSKASFYPSWKAWTWSSIGERKSRCGLGKSQFTNTHSRFGFVWMAFDGFVGRQCLTNCHFFLCLQEVPANWEHEKGLWRLKDKIFSILRSLADIFLENSATAMTDSWLSVAIFILHKVLGIAHRLKNLAGVLVGLCSQSKLNKCINVRQCSRLLGLLRPPSLQPSTC